MNFKQMLWCLLALVGVIILFAALLLKPSRIPFRLGPLAPVKSDNPIPAEVKELEEISRSTMVGDVEARVVKELSVFGPNRASYFSSPVGNQVLSTTNRDDIESFVIALKQPDQSSRKEGDTSIKGAGQGYVVILQLTNGKTCRMFVDESQGCYGLVVQQGGGDTVSVINMAVGDWFKERGIHFVDWHPKK